MNQSTLYSEYDSNGNVGAITDANGIVTRYTYDARNRVFTATNASTSAVTQYGYDTRGNLASVIYPEGNRIDYTYNLADRITEIRDTLGNRITYSYDDQGNRTAENIYDPQNALKKTLAYTYDQYNRIKTVVNPDSSFTRYDYDGRGNTIAAKDPRDNTTAYTYDALSRRSSMTEPFTAPTSYGYDKQDNPVSITDPKGNTTQYLFDDFGKKYQTVSPDTGTTSHVYDGAGNRLKTTDANNNTVAYIYDALNRLTALRVPADPAQDIVYTYDSTAVTYGIGRLTGRTDVSGTYIFHYDAGGNMIREDKTIDGIPSTTRFTYNRNGMLTSITYPSGRTVTYTVDTAGRVNQVSTTMNGTTTPLASSITHLPFGGITGLTYGNGLTLIQDYDNRYRISSILAGSILSRTYTYDPNGNITSIADPVTPSGATPVDPYATYTYENGSNILAGISGPASTVYTSAANGNIIAENNRTYVYDYLNRLISVSDSGTQIAAYTYNALNQRTKKVASAGTKVFHYDTQGHLIAESDTAGQTLVEYTYLNDQPLAMIQPAGQVYYYHNDHLGTPQVLTSSTGTIAWKATYSAFGAATVGPASLITSNLRFPGQYYDSETNLHYNWNRYYDSKTGRYLTPDPIGLDGGMNLFVYVEGNPVNVTDPLGLFGPGGSKTKYPGHGDFTGSRYFDYNREDRGSTQPTPFFGDPERHFRDLPISEQDVERAIASCDKEGFERAMHRGQDFFSHYSKGYRWDPGNVNRRCRGWGHGCDLSLPDQDGNAWDRAEDWTKKWIEKWNKKCNCKR